jgi:hypothetical protein
MTRLEDLAHQVALLDKDSLSELARILANVYPAHADVLESDIKVAFQEIIFEAVE